MSAIFGPQMSSVLSGTFIYEWIQEANDYGLISYPSITIQDGGSAGGPLNVPVGSPIPLQPDFNNLKQEWAANIPTGVKFADYTPTNTIMPCPDTTQGVWAIVGTAKLPDTPTKDNPTPGTSPAAGTTFAGSSSVTSKVSVGID